MSQTHTFVGSLQTMQTAFVDQNNNPYNPPTVVFEQTAPDGSVFGPFTWTDPTGDPSAHISNPVPGTFVASYVPSMKGQHRWFFQSSGSYPTVANGAYTALGPNDYPYYTGYCIETDVKARVGAGSWNAGGSSSISFADLDLFILQASAQVDSVLARSGYYVPLRAVTGLVIEWQAWDILRNVTAYLAAAMVEHRRSVPGSDNTAGNKADDCFALADDLLVRLETGADNLRQFNVDGPFEPVADTSTALVPMPATDADGMPSLEPMFTRNLRF